MMLTRNLAGAVLFLPTLFVHSPGWSHSNDTVATPDVEEIIVTASSSPLQLRKVGSAVSVLSAEDLDQLGVQYVADALRHVPGLAVSRSGNSGGFTQLRIRGSEANHVLVLLDGVEIAPADSGEVDLSTVLASDVSRIEVIRGPQSGLFGSNALAGVVAIYTDGPAAGQPLRLEAEAGSYETSRLALSGGLGDRDSGALFSLTQRRATGLNNAPEGSEEDDTETTAFSGRAHLRLGDSLTLSGTLRYVEKDAETDELDFSGGPNQGLIIDAPGTSDTVDQHLGVSGQWASADRRWVSQFSAGRTETELSGSGSFGPFGSDTSRTQLAVQATRTLTGNRTVQQVTGFLDRERETFRNTFPTDPSQEPRFERDMAGFGAEYRLELDDRLFLSAALRRDNNDEFDDATTWRLTGARTVAHGRGRAHFSYGKGVTNPTFFEQYGFTPGFFVGNPDLRPEESVGWDLGLEWRWDSDRYVTDVTVFSADLTDEIIPIFPSVVNAAGDSERRGVELSLRARLTSQLDLSASYTYTDSEDAEGLEELRRPSSMASLDLAWRLADERTRLTLGLVHNGSMLDTDFRNFYANGFVADRTRLGSYTLLQLGGSYQVNPRVELFGRVENALDENYQEVLGYRSPGRGVFAGVRVAFDR
ncbi:MAG: TonB-dependent receptor [Xanthomonadales bacterium]|nr:TonB-dependent receptor [Xanthomonadales bacterium]